METKRLNLDIPNALCSPRAIVIALLLTLALSPPAPAGAKAQTGEEAGTEQACPPDAKVLRVYRTSRDAKLPEKPNEPGVQQVQLNDMIRIEIAGLAPLKACAAGEPIVLFLDSRPFPNLTPYPPSESPDALNYELRISHVEGGKPDPWERVLGEPGTADRVVRVSVGLADGSPIESKATLAVDPVPGKWFFMWLVPFLLLGGAFGLLIRRTTILRNGLSDPEAADAKGSYSLAKTQAAWWFFFILASYLLIGIVIGDYTGSINATALTLLGIGGATAVLGTMIDNSGDPNLAEAERKTALTTKKDESTTLKNEITKLETDINAPPVNADVAQMKRQLQEKRGRLTSVQSQLRKLRGESEGFLRDIVSDANGSSFHRFQMVAWTILLSIVFVVDVYKNLAMPTFDPTLLGLMGVSSATYLGLKANEPTTPNS